MNRICRQILDDITFMAKHKLMDYSLLLITEKNPDYKDDNFFTASRLDAYTSHATEVKTAGQSQANDRMSIIPEEVDDNENDKSQNMRATGKDSNFMNNSEDRALADSMKEKEDSELLGKIKENAQNNDRKMTARKDIEEEPNIQVIARPNFDQVTTANVNGK